MFAIIPKKNRGERLEVKETRTVGKRSHVRNYCTSVWGWRLEIGLEAYCTDSCLIWIPHLTSSKGQRCPSIQKLIPLPKIEGVYLGQHWTFTRWTSVLFYVCHSLALKIFLGPWQTHHFALYVPWHPRCPSLFRFISRRHWLQMVVWYPAFTTKC